MNGYRFLCAAAIIFLMLGPLYACQPDDDDNDSDDDDDDDDNDTGDDDDTDDDDDDDDDDDTPICPEIVEGGRAGEDGSWAALDGAGRTLVVTTKAGELVLFTSADGLTWTMEHIVGRCEGFLPRDPQIVLAGDDTPHVVFFDDVAEVLVYVRRSGDGWIAEPLDTLDYQHAFSLAVDQSGAAHLAYYGDDTLYYATDKNGAWEREVAVQEYMYSHFDSHLELDESGNPRIAFIGGGCLVKLATYGEKGWGVETIDDQRYKALTLGVDTDGHNHIVAWPDDENATDLRYFHDLAGTWSEYTVLDRLEGHLSPIVFADDKLYFSVIYSSPFLEVDWVLSSLEPDGSTEMVAGLSSSQSFFPAWTRSVDGVFHCLFTSEYPFDNYMDYTNINGDWEFHLVDQTVTPTDPLAQTIDALGATHLLYFADGDDLFYHAQRRETGWERQPLINNLLPSTLDLIAGADGKPTAAFIQDNYPIVAVYDDGAWSYTTVETTAEVNDLTLAFDNDDRLHLALCDYSNEALLVLQLQGTTWNEIYSAPIKCSGLQLLFDHNNNTHLWYAYNGDTYYVTDAGGTWNKQLLQAGAHPTATPLLTSDGQVHLLTIGDGALRHFAGPPDAMQSEELVLLEDNMSFFPGFAADDDDRLYVTVREDDKLALLAGTFGDWQTVTFPEWGEVDIYSTISVDADGNCRLAWQADGALWFATMPCP
ncbi:MAG TPA: hypothetical protein PK961_02010 [bacterium]|nr:hypothetical protein [bacterium]